MGFNKGEWSELYAFLYLMDNPNLVVVDDELELISSEMFKVLEMMTTNSLYKISDSHVVKITKGKESKHKVSCIAQNTQLLLHKILAHKKAKGSFAIEELDVLIDTLFEGKKPKGASKVKGDLEAKVLDNSQKRVVHLSYNIKSNLGSSATLLNASRHTNFVYEISNINDEIMYETNAIKGRKKLLERCQFLEDKKAKIKFIKVESNAFEYNLKMVDSKLNEILANMLYLSYHQNEKDIKRLIELSVESQDEYDFYKKKIGDFTNAVTFGMRASEKWSGKNEVNGGIILVNKEGEVCLLDLIYFKEMVDKYLIENIKLESPSSSRYRMFEIYKENDRYFFKLNLQIRFK